MEKFYALRLGLFLRHYPHRVSASCHIYHLAFFLLVALSKNNRLRYSNLDYNICVISKDVTLKSVCP